MQLTEILFWVCLAIVFYTYIGYGIVLYCMVGLKRLFIKDKPISKENREQPHVTFMVCAYNEQDVVDMKMKNTLQLDYPKDKLHIVWVTDGSNDDTNTKLAKYPEVKILYNPERKGKTAALNRGIALSETSIIIMTDANTMVNSEAIKEIARLFEDPKVGCIAGEKRVMARHEGQAAAEGEGLYWKYESTLKRWDSELYSAMGAAGELNAIRKELYEEMPEDTLLDDFIMSMKMVDNGYRIAYTANAYAMEYGSANFEEEGKRKRRIAAGGLQSIWRLRQMLNPFRHPLATFQYISHRVLRWSITPVALLMLIPLNVLLVIDGRGMTYNIIWIMQIVFYAAALAGYIMACKGRKNKILYIAYYFLFMNINVFRGMAYLCKHKNNGAWEKAKRG